MRLFTLEHSTTAYRADFALYAAAVGGLGTVLLLPGPSGARFAIVLIALLGLLSWTGVEYALHRFVLHGVRPFQTWHEQHHQRPKALICTPTVVSAALVATLVFLPALALTDRTRAAAYTLGVLIGYLAYAVMHHAVHHWHIDNAWLRSRKRWHALHHGMQASGCYGVTSGFWDRVFGSVVSPCPPPAPSRLRTSRRLSRAEGG